VNESLGVNAAVLAVVGSAAVLLAMKRLKARAELSLAKHRSLAGKRMLLVEPIGAASLDPVLCLDELGSRAGDLVVMSNDGKFAREMCNDEQSPARWWVMGIIDDESQIAAMLPRNG